MNAAKFRGEKKSCFYQLSVLFPILKRMCEKICPPPEDLKLIKYLEKHHMDML